MKDFTSSIQHLLWTSNEQILLIYENKNSGYNFSELKLISTQDKMVAKQMYIFFA